MSSMAMFHQLQATKTRFDFFDALLECRQLLTSLRYSDPRQMVRFIDMDTNDPGMIVQFVDQLERLIPPIIVNLRMCKRAQG